MSKGEFIRFMEMLNKDEKARNDVKGMGTDFMAVAGYAVERGFSLEAADFSVEELTEEDLERVAGGKKEFFASSGMVGGFLEF